jgi:hypothetical protein
MIPKPADSGNDSHCGDHTGAMSDETHLTEITIQPDGRVYVFGLSRQVLELLGDLRPRDASLGRLLRQARAAVVTDDGGSPRAT